jgi:predicted helicase
MTSLVVVTILEVLDGLRAQALDERDKGDKFERLIKAYLTTDPEWTAKFSDVWLWSEWPGRSGVTDIGIDLVAANRGSGDFTAIQCKFYAPGRKVEKSDIDGFLALSMRPEFRFSQRIVFDTASGWSGNAEETLKGVAQRVDINYLSDAAIDWSQFRWATPEVVVPTDKKQLRPHQANALADVVTGLAEHDRGKLIMACGTGKTFTSLRIAEDKVGAGGSVLFLVPSIQLLSQSLREWMANAETDIRPFAVCSDVRVGRRTQTDDADMSPIDLTEPATTDPATLVRRVNSGEQAGQRMTVVFATYQSIDVIIAAQQQGLAKFDLVICDEAHRTTGVTLSGQDESSFVKVHDQNVLKASKRLYMTATPRVFGDGVRQKATEADAVLTDMNDESYYGPELHRLGFGDAVEAGLLTDYKVLVLTVDQQYIADHFGRAMAESGEIKINEAAKLIGCWNGLAKNFGTTDEAPPMRTAVAFAQNIQSSKAAAQAFPTMVDQAILDLPDNRTPLRVEARHVDGTMGIHERNAHLAWLKAPTSDCDTPVCRILTNAKCLSEGVDVPALDAVLFLTPRGSQVDVVQSVGRVMRKAPGKELGYIILPVVVASGVAPEDALRDNERYKVVWQVLQALRSHDDRFHALVNRIELNKTKPTDKVDIIPVTNPADTDTDSFGREDTEKQRQQAVQTLLEFDADKFRDAIYAKIVQKVGERRYWETFAKDVADIAQSHVTRIKGLLAEPDSEPAREFEKFLGGLRGNLNDSITEAEAIDMLAQHLVTRPIFETLFDGYDFAETNPVAKTMERMLATLDEHNLQTENQSLEKFYEVVRRRVEGVDNAVGKQRILIELYDKFFATAFKKTVDKLGIVYTPVEIVDFILRSADDVLRQEFGQGLTDQDVHILDPFTGTGTFVVRLLQSGLVKPHDLARKYANEIHANEILLLAYYIACVNIETTYVDLTGQPLPFPGLILTDTFQSWEPDDRPDLGIFPENNERLENLKKLPITVIIGNPPYSAGQGSANDDNANESYPALDNEIEKTYVAQSSATSRKAMYDSYIRAIKWASIRIKDRGVIAYVTNGGFLDSNGADGMRKTLAEEFSAIHIYNLRGNRRNAGAEGRPIWEAFAKGSGGSIAGIAIVVLVKNPAMSGPAAIQYAQVADFTSAREKVAEVVAAGSILGTSPKTITPNKHGDWINQRRGDFSNFIPLGSRDGSATVFASYSLGVGTNRDPWVYNANKDQIHASMEVASRAYAESLTADRVTDPRRIKWSSSLQQRLDRREEIPFAGGNCVVAQYRPFERSYLYGDTRWIHRPGALRSYFPDQVENYGMSITGVSSHADFSLIAVGVVPDLHVLDSAQFFPRWRYEQVVEDGSLNLEVDGEIVNGYRKIDNVTDGALKEFQAAYPAEMVTKDDIFFYVYGLLHSQQYRETYAADLKKMLPHIPFVQDFPSYVDAGHLLSELHLGYESVQPYALEGLDVDGPKGDAAYDFYAVGAKKMRFGSPTTDQKAAGERADRTMINYNDRITLRNIPLDAYRYRLGNRSAVEWIIDRYNVKTDKASGIVNNPNDWSRDVGNPRYVLDLLARIVTVSLETNKIVDSLPALDLLESRGS